MVGGSPPVGAWLRLRPGQTRTALSARRSAMNSASPSSLAQGSPGPNMAGKPKRIVSEFWLMLIQQPTRSCLHTRICGESFICFQLGTGGGQGQTWPKPETNRLGVAIGRGKVGRITQIRGAKTGNGNSSVDTVEALASRSGGPEPLLPAQNRLGQIWATLTVFGGPTDRAGKWQR